jgi:hypothetical protein
MRIRHALLLVVAAAALGCATGPSPESLEVKAQELARGIPDSEIGLFEGAVDEVLVPPDFVDQIAEPGDTGMRGSRLSEFAAPIAPHNLADYQPITRDDNLCLECHDIGPGSDFVEGEPVPLPDSHFVDLRNSPTEIGDTVAGTRYNCVACHVALTDAKPLVANKQID